MKFWALEQVKDFSQYIQREFRTPPNSIRIFDILKYNKNIHPKFESLIYNLFRDTLIAQNLRIAKELAYGKIQRQVVAMDGSFINRHGLLSRKKF